ncbi:Uncharacterised protein [uncultured archaeon]|nr:Uncharacterised protein [uncultured archaeon]
MIARQKTGEKVKTDFKLSGAAANKIDGMLDRMGKMSKVMGGNPNDFAIFRGKRVLDIGCGSRAGKGAEWDGWKERIWEPWMCRLLDAAGAKPVGVDIGKNSEKFKTYSFDITIPGNFEIFRPSSFDVVHNYTLACRSNPSPVLRRGIESRLKGLDKDGYITRILELVEKGVISKKECDRLERNSGSKEARKGDLFVLAEAIALEEIPLILRNEAQRILKEGGWYFGESQSYVKRDGVLEKGPKIIERIGGGKGSGSFQSGLTREW